LQNLLEKQSFYWYSIEKGGINHETASTGKQFWCPYFGKRGYFHGREISRCTYLAVNKEEAEQYGDVVLEVEYEPKENSKDNNYFDDDCWQIRVYVPISLNKVKRIE